MAARLAARDRRGAFFVDQFNNPANPLRARDRPPAPEIWEQMGHDVDAIVVRRRLRRHDDRADALLPARVARSSSSCWPIPVGSVLRRLHRAPARIGAAGSWAVEGIGEDFIPAIADLSGVRTAYAITDEESFAHARASCCKREGILGGSSTGTLLAAALRYCRAQTDAEARRQLRLRHRHALPVARSTTTAG